MTHGELVNIGSKWLKEWIKCPVVLTEFRSIAGEHPDILGFKAHCSYVVECKISKSDYSADKKKKCREPESGIGTYRYYLTPENLIQVGELPEHWGLIESSKTGDITLIRQIDKWMDGNDFKSDMLSERQFLYSLSRRLISSQRSGQ